MGNQHLIWGTVDSDINVRTVGDQQKQVADFRVNDGATWITVVAWEELAKKAASLSKGNFVVIGGKQRTRSYTPNGEDKKRYVTETVASTIDVIGAQPAAEDDDLGIPD
jgi:single-stranded DNA-binding protein